MKYPLNNLSLSIDPELKRKFKTVCAAEKVSMREGISTAIELYIQFLKKDEKIEHYGTQVMINKFSLKK